MTKMNTKKRAVVVLTGFVAIFILLGIRKTKHISNFWDLLAGSDSNADSTFHTSKMFSCGGKWMEEYSRYHANSLKSQSNDRKFLMYYCTGHGSSGCGGYGNRMISIVSLFYLAVALNRTFMIHWGGPELIETYLQPNRIDWRYNELKFKGLKGIKRYWGLDRASGYDHFFLSVREGNFLRWTQNVNFRLYLDHQVEKVSTIWYFAEKIWDNPHLKTIAKDLGFPMISKEYPFAMIGCAMSYLFKKSNALKREFSRVQTAFRDRPRPFIGIHIRSNDFHFGSNNPHSVRTRNVGQVYACADRVENALKRKFFSLRHKNFTWVLAADNKKLKAKALADYPNKLVTLDIVPNHLDVTKTGHQEIFRDILMDQLMILECDYFILTAASTFSTVIAGLRQFPVHSTTYGEGCQLNNEKIKLATPLK